MYITRYKERFTISKKVQEIMFISISISEELIKVDELRFENGS